MAGTNGVCAHGAAVIEKGAAVLRILMHHYLLTVMHSTDPLLLLLCCSILVLVATGAWIKYSASKWLLSQTPLLLLVMLQHCMNASDGLHHNSAHQS